MLVELIYEKTCPNIEAARSQLLKAFVEAGITPHWQEWEVSSSDAPVHVHGYGSPTILINGKDVSGATNDGNDYCCRVYSHQEDTNKCVPAIVDIVRVMNFAHNSPGANQLLLGLPLNGAILPAIGVALTPKLVCPACWPAYAGLLSAFGIGFIDYTPYLLPITAVFVVIAISALTYNMKNRHGYKPLLLGLLAAGTLLLGKFYYDSDATMYAGIILLVVASLWNTWPVTHTNNKVFPECVKSGNGN